MLATTARIASRRAVASNIQKRSFMPGVEAMHKSPSKIEELRKVQNAGGTWLGADGPTYLKQGNDKAWAAGATLLCSFAVLQIGRGYWNMAHGKGKMDD